jgi:RNA 3'-terminal phosphate cyclase (GTP)
MIEIDGSYGEGGGAILRQALALSTFTGKPFKINNIRSGRPKPGLKAQHMHSIMALEKLTGSTVTDCEVGSEEIIFMPGNMKNKSIDIDIGTAGSITLLLQALILPCIFSNKTITISLTGGTDVKWAQPVDYLANIFAPMLKEIAKIDISILKRGYYPKGGGKITIKIKGNNSERKNQFNLTERGKLIQIKGISHCSLDLEQSRVADRQADNAAILLSKQNVPVNIMRQYNHTSSTGSGITLWAMFSRENQDVPIIIGADSLGEKGKTSEEIGAEAAKNMNSELESEGVIDKYLADQLIPIMGVIKGVIKTSEITNHTKSNIYVTEKFLETRFKIKETTIIAH